MSDAKPPMPGETRVEVRLPQSGAASRMAQRIDRGVAWLARHWLAVFNVLVGIFFALPFLAPVLMHAGLTGPGRLIYYLYAPTCHQLPERSYFLFGPRVVYDVSELEASGAIPAGLDILHREFLRWPGSAELGWKVAYCERDAAIYGSILLGGLAFGLWRRQWQRLGQRNPKLPLWAYATCLVPIAVDGFTQLFGWRESDWLLRTITGMLFGLASVALAYPHIQDAMEQVVRPPLEPAANPGRT